MKLVFVKILCWVAGIGAVAYIGLTIVNSIPSLNSMVASVPFVGQIPTPIINTIAESTMIDSCKSSRGENAEVVRISDAPESEGSYPRWECVVKNHNKTEDEYQEYLTELGKYKEWPRDPNYKLVTYDKAECKYYEGIWYAAPNATDDNAKRGICIAPELEHYEERVKTLENYKKFYDVQVIKDYSKE